MTKTALDDLLVKGGREALLKCELIPLSSPLFAEARRREERRQERLANGHTADEAPGFGGFSGSSPEESGRNSPWPEPGELQGGLLSVPVMSEKMIPEPFRPWLLDIAERIQCPLEFPTVGAVVAVAGMVGRRVGIRPKKHDDWLVIPNLWGAVIGRPGVLKSPALAEVMKPLHRLENQARTEYETELEKWELTKLLLKAQKEDLERKIREALKQGQDPAAVMGSASFAKEEEPIPRRYIVNDSTVEKLGEILNQNPRGVLLFRDELSGWFRMLDRDGHENDRAFYLEAWNGGNSYTYDRIGRGPLHIKAACVSMLGSIQPGPLAGYLRAAVRGGADDDGLMPRIQLAVYPDDLGEWKNVDRWPDTEAKNRAFSIFQQLATQPVSNFGVTLVPAIPGVVVNTDEEVPFLRFALDAQELFDGWRSDLEQKIRSREEHPALEAHLAKYRSLMPSLALLFHLVEVADGKAEGGKAEGAVSKRAAAMAAAWCDFLEAHARRIYQGVTQHALFAARQLAERIKVGKLKSPFTPHDVYNKGWVGLSTPEDVEQAARILEEISWVRSEQLPSGVRGGRPRFHYHISPRLMKKEQAA